jgi:hypothetical protein
MHSRFSWPRTIRFIFYDCHKPLPGKICIRQAWIFIKFADISY